MLNDIYEKLWDEKLILKRGQLTNNIPTSHFFI